MASVREQLETLDRIIKIVRRLNALETGVMDRFPCLKELRTSLLTEVQIILFYRCVVADRDLPSLCDRIEGEIDLVANEV